MERSRPLARRPLVTLLTAAALAASGLTALTSAARAADADLAKNGGFDNALDQSLIHKGRCRREL
ncbi:hypothetical protein ACFXAQ_14460, partial [Streptomyces olivaceus]|uniref:hypothetical protein n=1 Tax=Streptomyces olivaceus TaxID=47716 RepID=UPI00368A13A4